MTRVHGMRRSLRSVYRRALATALLLAGAALCVSPTTHAADTAGSDAPASFAIRQVRVFDGERFIDAANVVVRDGRIAAVGAGVGIPPELRVIDGHGKTLLPGLIDAHVHSWGEARADALRFGVTTELDMFTDWHALAAAKRERESTARTAQADLWSAGTLATVKGGHGTEYGMPIPVLAEPQEAQAFVDARVGEGSDYLKIVLDDGSVYGPSMRMPTLRKDTAAALIAAAHKDGKLALVHVATQDDARFVLENGADGLAHVFSDSAATPATIELARKQGRFVVATLSVMASIAGAGEGAKLRDDARIKPFLSASQADMLGRAFGRAHPELLANAVESVRRLHAAGVPILAGTDAGNPGTAHGASLHGELALLTQAGLSPVEALQAATSAPAQRFGLGDRGRIAAGLRADLLLVNGDPAHDITATRDIARIWKNGYALERTAAAAASSTAEKAGAAPSDALVSDFDGDAIDSRYGFGWQPTTDQLMQGHSTVEHRLVAGGAEGSRGALRVRGEIKAGFAHPWSGVMFFPGAAPMQPVDFSAKKEIVLWVKGDGRRYSAMLFSGGAAGGGMPAMQDFVAGPQWQQIRLPLAAFPGADPARVSGFAFCAGQPLGAFEFAIDRVEVR